jgi:hypothetical protein
MKNTITLALFISMAFMRKATVLLVNGRPLMMKRAKQNQLWKFTSVLVKSMAKL